MSSLDASLISIWEMKQDSTVTENAIRLLSVFTDADNPECLSIGERDRLVMAIRKKLFGSKLRGLNTCPFCRVDLMFDVDIDSLDFDSFNGQFTCISEGVNAVVRTITSRDIINIQQVDPTQRRHALLSRCLVTVNGRSVADSNVLTDEHIKKIEDTMEASDANSLISAEQICASCGKSWSVILDIVSVLMEDIDVYVRHRLLKVCELARLSGWSETEILGMSNCRREYYLEHMRE